MLKLENGRISQWHKEETRQATLDEFAGKYFAGKIGESLLSCKNN